MSCEVGRCQTRAVEVHDEFIGAEPETHREQGPDSSLNLSRRIKTGVAPGTCRWQASAHGRVEPQRIATQQPAMRHIADIDRA
jgi:hypothetical protein